MPQQSSKVLVKLELPTVNRGTKTFLVSKKGDSQYFAYELGDKTQWAIVTGSEEVHAHRLNDSMRYGNQYVKSWKQKPFTTIGEAMDRCKQHANISVMYF